MNKFHFAKQNITLFFDLSRRLCRHSPQRGKWIFRALRKKDERGSPPTREVCEAVWMLGCFKTLRNNRLIDPLLLFIHNRLIDYAPTLSRGFYFPLLIPFLFFRVVLLAFLWFCYKLFVLPEFYWICPKIRFFCVFYAFFGLLRHFTLNSLPAVSIIFLWKNNKKQKNLLTTYASRIILLS